MEVSRVLFVMAICFVINIPVDAQTKKIAAADAKSHAGERASVCGNVVSIRHADKSRGQPDLFDKSPRAHFIHEKSRCRSQR